MGTHPVCYLFGTEPNMDLIGGHIGYCLKSLTKLPPPKIIDWTKAQGWWSWYLLLNSHLQAQDAHTGKGVLDSPLSRGEPASGATAKDQSYRRRKQHHPAPLLPPHPGTGHPPPLLTTTIPAHLSGVPTVCLLRGMAKRGHFCQHGTCICHPG